MNVCANNLCTATTESACTAGNSGCVWSNVSVPGTDQFIAQCNAPNLNQQIANSPQAAAAESATCTPVTKSLLPVAILLIVFIVILTVGLSWMIYRQRQSAGSTVIDFKAKELMGGDELDDLMEAGGRDIDDRPAQEGLKTTKKKVVL